MVLDRIENHELYHGLSKGLEFALKTIASGSLDSLPDGRHSLRGDEIFAIVQTYNTKSREDGKWEAHRKYIDIQCVTQGTEVMGYANLRDLRVQQAHNVEKDVAFFEGHGDFVTVKQGMFTIFFPEDVHMPGLFSERLASVKKIVIKVAM